MLATWSNRVMAGCGLILVIISSVEASLTDHMLLPSPLNVLAFLVLVTAFALAASGRLTAVLLARHDHQEARDAALRAWLDEQLVDIRLGVTSIEGRLDRMDAPTVVLPRLHLVAVGRATAPAVAEDGLPGYARGYADGLARQPMETVDAKVIPFDRN